MRSKLVLGLLVLVACGGDAPTAPESGALTLARRSNSTELPSATNPAVETEFVCGPSYPTDGGVIAGWCTDLIRLVLFEPDGKNKWMFGWKVGGEFPGDTLFFTYGVYHGPKPVFHHDGIYQFDALNQEIVGGREYMELSVQNLQPVNWGIFRTQ
jgi:hypothetical protein